MEKLFYFHLYANGDDARNFIICEADYYYEFNLIAVCAYKSGVVVLAFSLEDTHPHFLLFGTCGQVDEFKRLFTSSTLHHIRMTRGTGDGVILELQSDIIDNRDYLMNVGTYVIIQSTKDGKSVMPYDYKWCTGSMYFRSEDHIPIWCTGRDMTIMKPVPILSLSATRSRSLIRSIEDLPGNWLTCNGFILPHNYIDVKRYEAIYQTHNCFRTFMSGGRTKNQEVMDRMAASRGVMIEDMESRKICGEVCHEMFGKQTSRWLSVTQRLELAKALRVRYRLSKRQISTLCRLPESEIDKYIR